MDKKNGSESFSSNKSPPKKKIGLPKIGQPRAAVKNKEKYKKVIPRETKFMPLNATNVEIVKSYFDSITPNLYLTLAKKNQYILYQLEGKEYEIFLIPLSMSKFVKNLTREVEIKHAGIHLGYMRRKMTKTGFIRAFYLSYEGGEFLLNYLQKVAPEIKNELQVIQIDLKGEKSFLYGMGLEMERIISDTSKLVKYKLIFVQDQNKNYLGLGLLRVKQAGSVKNQETFQGKNIDEHSRSRNFHLDILNLTDAGHYLRDGY